MGIAITSDEVTEYYLLDIQHRWDVVYEDTVRTYQNGELSDWDLWQLCSSNKLPMYMTQRLYEELGFKPFSGFPLVKVDGSTHQD
jgi:hypothetical protein